MSIKAIVFDLDDTLYPEIDYVKSGFFAVAKLIEKLYGLKNAEKELLANIDKWKQGIFDWYLKQHDIKRTEQNVGELVDTYRYHKPNIKLREEVVGTLKDLKNAGYKLGIITDGRPNQQRLKIAALGLDKLVDNIIITDELGGIEYRKPNPLSFKKMCKALNVSPEEMVYVGDNPRKDFAVKKFLPIKTVSLNNGLYQQENYLNDICPDAHIDSLANLLKIDFNMI